MSRREEDKNHSNGYHLIVEGRLTKLETKIAILIAMSTVDILNLDFSSLKELLASFAKAF